LRHPGGRPRKVRWSDLLYARQLRELGLQWNQIADMLGYVPGTLRSAVSAMRKTIPGPSGSADPSHSPSEAQ
jgi:hypothetical protein